MPRVKRGWAAVTVSPPQMELLDRFWPASRQLAKCGLARFGKDLSQSGSRRTESLSSRQKWWIPWGVSMMEIQKKKKRNSIYNSNNNSFLKIHAFAVQTKSDVIYLACFSLSWTLLVHLPFSSVLSVRADSRHRPSFHACAPDWQTQCCDHVCCQMLQIRARSEVNRRGRSSSSDGRRDDKELLILMDRSSSGVRRNWRKKGGWGGGEEGVYQWVNSWQADYKSRAGFIGNPKDLWDQHWESLGFNLGM